MKANANTFDKFAVLSCSICERKFNQAETFSNEVTQVLYCSDCYDEQRRIIVNAMENLAEYLDEMIESENGSGNCLWTSAEHNSIWAILSAYVDAELRDKYESARREARTANAIESAINLAIEHLQKVNGIESGDNASVFFSGEKGEAITKVFAEYLDFEKLYSV